MKVASGDFGHVCSSKNRYNRVLSMCRKASWLHLYGGRKRVRDRYIETPYKNKHASWIIIWWSPLSRNHTVVFSTTSFWPATYTIILLSSSAFWNTYRVFTYITVIWEYLFNHCTYSLHSWLKDVSWFYAFFEVWMTPKLPVSTSLAFFYTLQNTHFVWTHFSDPLQTWISRWIRVISSPNLNHSMFEWYRIDV